MLGNAADLFNLALDEPWVLLLILVGAAVLWWVALIGRAVAAGFRGLREWATAQAARPAIAAPGRATLGKSERIPFRVKREVRRRDGGRCVDCGSRQRLDCDYIIPPSRGGAKSAAYLQLRCERCKQKQVAGIEAAASSVLRHSL